MKVRVILHDSDHSVCYDKGGQFLAERGAFRDPDVIVNGTVFDCQHGKKARVQTCELKVPEKERDSVSEGIPPGGSEGLVS